MECIDCEKQWGPCPRHEPREPKGYGVPQLTPQRISAPLSRPEDFGRDWEGARWSGVVDDPVGGHENIDGTRFGASEPEHSERDEPGLFDVVMAWAVPLAIIVGGWALVVSLVRRWCR